MDLLKSIGGRAVTAALVLAVVAVAVAWWRMDDAGQQAIFRGAGRIAGWAGVVVTLPWATFFLSGFAARRDSNLAGAALVAGYTLAEGVLLAWLFGFAIAGAAAWTAFAAAVLIAGVYNLLVCDWIAERME